MITMEKTKDKIIDWIEKEWNMEYGLDYFTYRGMKPAWYPNPDDSIKKFVLFMIKQAKSQARKEVIEELKREFRFDKVYGKRQIDNIIKQLEKKER